MPPAQVRRTILVRLSLQVSPRPYQVVDGQQRLSTLVLIIHALLVQLPNDDWQRIADTAILLEQDHKLKLDFGTNAPFVSSLLSGAAPLPNTGGQRKLRAAYEYACERASALFQRGGRPLIIQWLETIKKLEIMQYVAPDVGRIRMFQTINDRGLSL